MIKSYLSSIGLSELESNVFLTLYKLGTQPASIVARYLSQERTTVYKILVRLNKLSLVSLSKIKGIQMFYIPDIGVVKKYLDKKQQEINNLETSYTIFESEIKKEYLPMTMNIPKITIYDGLEKISNLYDDIISTIKEKDLKIIKMFASNTVSEQMSNIKLKDIGKGFFENIRNNNLILESYIGDGQMIMERVTKNLKIEDIINLPASQSATNIYLASDSIYLLILTDEPIGIKIKSDILAETFYFLFDQLKI